MDRRGTVESRLKAAEMPFLRYVSDYTLRDQGTQRRKKVTSGNKEVGLTDTRKGEELAGTSAEDTIRKSSQENLILSTG
jgi:hypothetical protein